MSKKTKKKITKKACLDFLHDLGRIREIARDYRLEVRCNQVKCGRKVTYHVMFENNEGKRVLDYWPATGTTYSSATGTKGIVSDCLLALDEAVRISTLT